jgi:rare lipoprotein A (peptidoglycan hydrolase)
VNIVVTVVLLPAMFSPGDDESPSVTTVLLSAPAASQPEAERPLPQPDLQPLRPATTTTTTAPAPQATSAAPPTTAAARPATTTTTAPPPAPAKPPAAPTTAPPTTTTEAHRHEPGEGRSESGRATWYELEGARAGICAHKTLPFGTIVTVTNTNTGRSIQCEVGDRGPFVDGYIIDLFRTDFEQLAPTSSGWFPAKITW